MPDKDSDIRIIDGDLVGAVGTIKDFLSGSGFKIDREEILDDGADIKACNQQRSLLKLFLSNSPQIVRCRIKQRPDDRVQVETRIERFRIYRLFYYSCLAALLSGLSLSLISAIGHVSPNKMRDFFYSAKTIFFCVFFLLSATALIFKAINAFPACKFIDDIFFKLSVDGATNEVIIRDRTRMPELWNSLFAFFLSIAAVPLFIGIDGLRREVNTSFMFLGWMLILLALVILLLIVLIRQVNTSPRMIFLLAGFGVCIPFTIYLNGPVFIVYDLTDFLNDAKSVIEELDHPSAEALANLEQAGTDLASIKKDAQNILLVSIFFLSVFLFSIIVAFSPSIKRPIKIAHYLDRFNASQKDSFYNKSLQPESTSITFNMTIFILWLFIAVANVVGLYFAFSVCERALSGTNVIFKSLYAGRFFDNTGLLLAYSLPLSLLPFGGMLFHRIMMILYSAPAILVLFIVFRKNIKSMLKGYVLLNRQPGRYREVEAQLSEKSGTMCKLAGAGALTIKVMDSPDINAETQYIGFPVFKNILVISTGALDELDDDELDALLAHEVWHTKRHTLIRKLLCFLSDYSLFGNGFLAVLQNSYLMEREADDFAVRWLTKKHLDGNKAISSLKSLLEKREEINWRNAVFQPGSSLNFAMVKNDSYRDGLLQRYDNATMVGRLKINLALSYQIYFGEEVLSYFHPSISQRVAWIEEVHGTDKAN